jgi:hypothetical protein
MVASPALGYLFLRFIELVTGKGTGLMFLFLVALTIPLMGAGILLLLLHIRERLKRAWRDVR